MNLSDSAFAVVDCETTGYHPSARHRVIELAVVPVGPDGRIGTAWSTLLRPDRDLGPTDIHGIRGRDLADAPRFDEILGAVLRQLAGRVVVAHNARFDCAFLEAEFARAGINVAPLPSICTLALAHRLGRGIPRARLGDCCEEAGIHAKPRHTAEADAKACAELFCAYLLALIAHGARTLADLGCAGPMPLAMWPARPCSTAPKPRGQARTPPIEPHFLSRLVRGSKSPLAGGGVDVAAYVDVLDRALEDRRLTDNEQADLAAMAGLLGLSADRVRAVHADYLATLVTLAYRDGVVTEREHADLELVADALGISGLESTLAQLALRRGEAGKPPHDGQNGLTRQSVCFTGTLLCRWHGEPITRELAEVLAERAGMQVATSVTKTLDMLVVADPDSMSGKARKARSYGTRIIAETAFWPMIGIEVT